MILTMFCLVETNSSMNSNLHPSQHGQGFLSPASETGVDSRRMLPCHDPLDRPGRSASRPCPAYRYASSSRLAGVFDSPPCRSLALSLEGLPM
jgi:hypothetical protein